MHASDDKTVQTRPEARAVGRELRWVALESLLIVVGIVAAFMLEDWARSRQDAARLEAMVNRLNQEVAINLAEYEYAIDVIGDRLKRLNALADEVDGTKALMDYMPRFDGFWTPDLSDVTWQQARLDPLISNLDPDYIEALMRLHIWEDYFARIDGRIVDLTFSEFGLDNGKAKLAWRVSTMLMTQQLSWARECAAAHRDFLTRFAPELLPVASGS
jgi:type II secretory pathway pseudopilin PulG